VIEENNIGGNINGILITQPAVRNLIRRNVIAGNPPVQLSVTFGPPRPGTPSPDVGADIRDAAPSGSNTFEGNHCITYEGATMPRPCPNFSRSRLR